MIPKNIYILCLSLVACAGSLFAENTIRSQTTDIHLNGPRATYQLVISDFKQSYPKDITPVVQYKSHPAGVISIDKSGHVTALKDGTATIEIDCTLYAKEMYTVHSSDVQCTSVKVTVSGTNSNNPINFTNEVVPVFTKQGCNGGSCHGKSGGQNGFKLSLFGYEPWNDHEWLVRESRGRRLSPAAPEASLLLTKATGELPHEGGIRLERDSPDYQLVADWIRQGMLHDPEQTTKVEKIEVYPKERVCQPGDEQQLAVTAFFADGTARDITRAAIFEANQETMAEVTPSGLVTLKSETGSTSIMVRFQEHVDVFRATIPLGKQIPQIPDSNNYIDQQIFSKLQLLGLPPSAICDDATFLRRVTVDVAGRLPEPEEVKQFLASNDPNKRAAKVDELLDSPDYPAYFAQKWAAILRNKRAKDTYQRGYLCISRLVASATSY